MSKPSRITSDYMGTVDAAREVGVSEATMRRYGNLGVCKPVVLSNGKRVWSPQDVAAAKKYRERR